MWFSVETMKNVNQDGLRLSGATVLAVLPKIELNGVKLERSLFRSGQ